MILIAANGYRRDGNNVRASIRGPWDRTAQAIARIRIPRLQSNLFVI